jgi:hypothetical protein
VDGEAKYRDAAVHAMDAVLTEIVPQGRWEDFETYWSCCSWGKDKYLGRKIERNAMHKQNSFSMFWNAEALLETYRHRRTALSPVGAAHAGRAIHVPAGLAASVRLCSGSGRIRRDEC